MMAEIPSTVTIVEEADIDVCELPQSVPESLPLVPITNDLPIDQSNQIHEFPFEFLPGEKSIDYSMDLTDGYIYLTSYRLFAFSSPPSHCSFLNCPLRLIESIEIKDTNYLCVQCKDIRTFRLMFSTSDKCCLWLKKLNESISSLNNLEDIFAIKYHAAQSKDSISQIKSDYLRCEYKRLKLDSLPWRLTDINRDQTLCPSYPNLCAVPASITDEEIHIVAKFRSYRRFPSIVWRHQNGAVIARTSQPEVGWLFWRSKEDEKMIQAIIHACAATQTNPSETRSNRLLIVDARCYTAALANRAKGGGFEYPPYYNDCDVDFMNLPNIHTIRKSAQMLRVVVANAATQGETWLSQLESTRWLQYLSALLTTASMVVAAVDKQARPVLVHCSDGWDRTPQIISLAALMLDSHYRTIEGFQTLIQREWFAYGHKFADRCGNGICINDPNERSPVFLQWLDCVYQLLRQDPTAFQFNEMFLLKLAHHTYTCLYGTFLYNNDSERSAAGLDTRTTSIWSLLNIKSSTFINHLFDEGRKKTLYPSTSVRDLSIWSNLYLREICQTPTGSAEHPSTNLPVRVRSYEDLSNSMINGFHRSISDPNLSDPINPESVLSINTRSPHPPLPTHHSFGSLRPQTSMSTSSLFGPPHQLGTSHGSSHDFSTQSHAIQLSCQTSLPITHSPDNRMKPHSFLSDDSAPDITQLALSFQRFPLNVNSVDSIIRTMTRPRKHTTSTSSTTSSLSETWSLTRINSNDQNQTQRMRQHLTSNKIIRLIRKRIDIDGLTKINEEVSTRMIQQDRAHKQKLENLEEQLRSMHRFVCTLISINQHQQISPRMDAISQSNINSPDSSSCSSWHKIDNSEPTVARWIPDANGHTCHSCHMRFLQWPISRKHHCRECGNVFCGTCANYYKLVPTSSLTQPVRVCQSCFLLSNDNNNMNNSSPNTIESSTRAIACPMPIQSGCRQAGGTPNGSFTSAGGQKVKG